ncbi:MAG: DUF2520 domain-containing protein [Nocardioidaceae bacterium]|nr:DUF2520 domain-containing protein [Nocardioidaceae bacterium]
MTSAVSPHRYRVGVVGAGRVGAVLGAALRQVGHEVVAVSGASPTSRLRIETLLPGLSPLSPAQVAAAADLLLLTVPDDRLGSVVARLASAGAFRPGLVVVHTSGRHGTEVLAAAAEAGAVTIALHPAMTFTGTDVDLDRLRGCVFGLTAAADGRAVGAPLVDDLGGEVVIIPEEQRTLYHAALAHGANHLVTLVGQAMDLLRAAGSTDPARTLRPLLTAALDNALAYGDAALTGPVVRGDTRTVSDHLAALAAVGDEAALPGAADVRTAYAAMAAATAGRAVRSGRLRGDDAADMTALTSGLPARSGR